MKLLQEQYVRIPRQFLESPALRVLNINERRALDRILIEHQSKAGNVKDGLIVTYRDFVRTGVQPKHVTNSLRVLRELGIVECTRNMGGSVSGRTPNMWRPTFLPRTSMTNANDATHDYLNIKTVAQAKAIAQAHRFHETRKQRPPPVRPARDSAASQSTRHDPRPPLHSILPHPDHRDNSMTRKLADDLCYPPRAMRADRAAAYLSLATSTFLKLVDEKRLPKGKRLGGIVFWDRAELDSFVEHYEGEADEAEDKWEKILGAET